MSLRTYFRLFTHTQLMPILESGEETLVGGQAVMEGVMMRAPHSYCVAVRKKNGDIVTEQMPMPRISEKYPIFKYPVFRGVGTLFQAMSLGMKALKFSADVVVADEEAEQAKRAAAAGEGGGVAVAAATAPKKKEVPQWAMALNILFSLGMFIVLNKLIPLSVATWLKSVYPSVFGHLALFNLADGVVRMLIFLVMMYLLSLSKEFHRIFEYHGAEHKVVFNYESGKPVNVENAQQFTTYHPRCGTSFLFVVILVSIVFYMFIPFEGFLPKLLSRIALLLPIAGVSYELIRFAAKRQGSLLAMLAAPGLWLQRITTKPPADAQAAVAIHALEGAMALEKQQGGELVIA
ncbi:MAG TPA: DUF1385 domain-containing protein [Candidatus Solibacter sp.]|nr:DUF1385 domain-containing protein [Candidatus Solibacter sp.]